MLMVELLVKEGVELRHESIIEKESLMELCEAVRSSFVKWCNAFCFVCCNHAACYS